MRHIISLCVVLFSQLVSATTLYAEEQNKTVQWYIDHPDEMGAKLLDCSDPKAVDKDCDAALEAMLSGLQEPKDEKGSTARTSK